MVPLKEFNFEVIAMISELFKAAVFCFSNSLTKLIEFVWRLNLMKPIVANSKANPIFIGFRTVEVRLKKVDFIRISLV